MKHPFLSLKVSNAPYEDELKRAAERVISSGRYLLGKETEALESEVAAYLGAPYSIAVSNGLDAIRLIFRAYMEEGKLQPGDEVIFPANTYIASVLPITELGLTAIPAPADPATLNLDLGRIDEYLTPRTKAVLVVHLYGTPCWDAKILTRLHERGILIIEDNAQAFGAISPETGLYGSDYCGALGDAAAISFYPTKNLGALGDAGMVVTYDENLAKTIRALANYGSDYRYHNIYRGYNNRIDELQAAFLRVKLPHIDAESEKREDVARAYRENISHPAITLPATIPGGRQVWHQFVITTPHRDRLKEWLESHGVATDIHYQTPPHRQPCYADTFSGSALSETDLLAQSLLSLPIANITTEDALEIAGIINRFPEISN